MRHFASTKRLWTLCAAIVLGAIVFPGGAGGHDRDRYLSAKGEFERLRKSELTAGNLRRWRSLAERFERLYLQTPRSRYGDGALFYRGTIYRELYAFGKDQSDWNVAIESWKTLLGQYPKSHWVAETRYRLGLTYEEDRADLQEAKKHYVDVVRLHGGGELARRAKQRLEKLKEAEEAEAARAAGASASPAKTLLTQIRYTSSQSYTRVTVGLSAEARYETHQLKEDKSKGLPPRIYVDVLGARLGLTSTEPIVVQDGLLRQVRVGQFAPDVVRVVLDMTSLGEHRTFLLPDPYRLVIDIQGQSNGAALASVPRGDAVTRPLKAKKPPYVGIRKVVLDPGHGGKDPGAIGVGGLAEKDIVLSIAKKLARKLRKEMGLEVVLTRESDTFVALEDRTAIANAEEADLFISLHTNASPNGEARGLETYYLDNTNDEASIRLAARENGASRTNISDLQFILSDLTQNLKLEDSITLAHRLHGSLVSGIGRKHGGVRDLGVKKALFYVLVGARMPSVLVELFFITNRIEGRAIRKESYQDAIVDALFDGIQKYNESMLAGKTL